MVGLLHMAAVVLVVAGALKIRDPQPTVAAIRGAALPASAALVYLLGGLEISVGLTALVVGGVGSGLAIAALFAGFAGFIVRALRTDGSAARCGCFGASDAPPSMLHVVLNAGIATGAVVAALIDPAAMADVVVAQPGLGIPYLTLIAVGTTAVFLTLDRLPRLRATARGDIGAVR